MWEADTFSTISRDGLGSWQPPSCMRLCSGWHWLVWPQDPKPFLSPGLWLLRRPLWNGTDVPSVLVLKINEGSPNDCTPLVCLRYQVDGILIPHTWPISLAMAEGAGTNLWSKQGQSELMSGRSLTASSIRRGNALRPQNEKRWASWEN